MNVLIIEDEYILQMKLQESLLKIDPSIVVLQIIKSVEQAIKWFETHTAPDLIFLDIQLSDGNCFEIFESIKINSPVVFTTAHNDYAIKAFELNSIDYLVKPIDEEKLKRSIAKYKELRNTFLHEEFYFNLQNALKNLNPASSTYKSRLLVYKGEQLIPVNTKDIAYIYSEDKVSFLITTDNRRYIINHSLDGLETQLNPSDFFRANRQFILNILSIKNIVPDFNYKLSIEVHPPCNQKIIISREKSQIFKDWLNK